MKYNLEITEGYLTATAHYIDESFEMKSRVLQTVAMPERHTGVNIAERLTSVIQKFGVSSQDVSAVVRDGAYAMDACMASLREKHDWDASSVTCAGT